MKVLFISSSVTNKAGGVYDSMRYLARALTISENVNVSVLGVKRNSEELNIDEWFGVEVGVSNYYGPYQYAYAPSLIDHAISTQSNLIHSHGLWMYPNSIGYKVFKKTKKPYIISPHGMLDEWILNKSSFKKKLALKLFEKSNIHGASCIHALTEAEASSIRDIGYKGPIFIQPNGVSLPDLSLKRKGVLKDYRGGILKANKRRLLFLGRIDNKKGINQLVNAWKFFSATQDWDLLICGWGGEDLVRDIKLISDNSDSIHFLGPRFSEEKDFLFKNVDAFILPSFSEGLPMSVLEAWSYEKPVIMSKYCNLESGFEYNAAIQVNPNVESIVNVLENTLARDDLCSIGRNGRRLVENSYCWEKISCNFLNLYRWVNNGGEKPNSLYLD